MSNDSAMEAIEKYVRGLTTPEQSQAGIRPGDPTLAALGQYLQVKSEILRDRIVVDFGSGNGITAHVLDAVFADRSPSRYLAVDFAEPLQKLALPLRVHNNSLKVTIDDFYETQLAALGNQCAVVIIRHVLHELAIEDTAALFCRLTRYLAVDCEIYVQDMINLPRPEIGRAGWLPEIFAEVMSALGLQTNFFQQMSYGGTNWFAAAIRPKGQIITETDAERAFADGRSKQRDVLAARLADLHDAEKPDFAEIVRLNGEIGSIAAQLVRYHPRAVAVRSSCDAVVLPTVPTDSFGPYDYALTLPHAVTAKTGLEAILSNKRLIELGTLIASAKHHVMMMGYSQRSLFTEPVNVSTLADAAIRGIAIRVVVASPDGPVARIRAVEPIYSNPDQLRNDIEETIAGARAFSRTLESRAGVTGNCENFAVRRIDGPLYASYLIVDDVCYLSLYARSLSGSRGGCFLFRHIPTAPMAYYDALVQDFEAAWSTGVDLLT
jgi:hypothetical protein